MSDDRKPLPPAVIGRRGGQSRAEKLPPERRKEIAQKAAVTRWGRRVRVGDMVLTSDGRLGLVRELLQKRSLADVQFGATGPFRIYKLSEVRHATEEEIQRAGLGGVGRNPAPVAP